MIPVWKFKFYFGNCRRIIKELKLIMRDTYVHKGKRKQLIDYLHQKIGISDSFVLNAMNEVPRHLFIESVFEDYAYEDRAFPIAAKQTISHPSTVAEQTELLEVNEGEKILEIGTGCGYQTAVLIKMNALVYTVERQKDLYDFSSKILRELTLDQSFKALVMDSQDCLRLLHLIKFW